MLCGGLWGWEQSWGERVWGGSCVRGSHNAERHLANKGRNNNGTEGLRKKRGCLYARRTQGRRGTPQQSAALFTPETLCGYKRSSPAVPATQSLPRPTHEPAKFHLTLSVLCGFYSSTGSDFNEHRKVHEGKPADQWSGWKPENFFNVRAGDGGHGRQVTPPLDKINRILSLLSSFTAFCRVCLPQASNTCFVESTVDSTHFS